MKQQAYLIKEADEAILLALARYHYLTAAQASRLLYPNLNDENRYMQRRLKTLENASYVLRLRALPTPRYGMAPHVFTLHRKGRQHLQRIGIPVRRYFRPSEEHAVAWNMPFIKHTLYAIDVLIAASRLCSEYDVSCPRMRTERDLKRQAIKVDVPATAQSAARRVAVIPDGFFELAVPNSSPVSVALELDRSTEDQKVWRQKVAAYAVWSQGPYRETFETDNLTIAVVCPDDTRTRQLIDWTTRELALRNCESLAELFLFTSASPVTMSPRRFFFGPVWHQAAKNSQPLTLLDAPYEHKSEQGVVYQTV